MNRQHRANHELRAIRITRHFTKHAEGSVLIAFGNTQVICNASILDRVPPFLKGSRKGWLTAEYGMLPRATHSRVDREASRGRQNGRTQEIQRLIGRSLRQAVNLNLLGERTIYIDCDVIQADGGTRTAAITGACVALADAVRTLQKKEKVVDNLFQQFIASVSVGIVNGEVRVDLDYKEDSNAETDMNIVMDESGRFIEIQGTAEKQSFTEQQLQQMSHAAQVATRELIAKQKEALASE